MRAKRLIASLAGLAIAGGLGMGITSPAFAQPERDNIHPLIENSGAVNCRGGDTCVKKVGDTAEVSWVVQTTPFLKSSDNSRWVTSVYIAIPNVVENLKLETVSLPDDKAMAQAKDGAIPPVKEISHEVNLVSDEEYQELLKKHSEEAGEGAPYALPDITAYLQNDSGEFVESNPDTWTAALSELGVDKDVYSVTDASRLRNFTNAKLYNLIEAKTPSRGVYTFKVSGTVKVQAEDTYLPIRVFNTTQRYLLGFPESLQVHDWAQTGDFPEYSLSSPEVNKRIAKLQTTREDTDGRLGSDKCAPTSEIYDRNDILGSDIEQLPSSLKNVREMYAKAYNLTLNPLLDFYVSPFDMSEDGCDQSDFHITICADNTEKPEIETPNEPTLGTPEKPTSSTPEKLVSTNPVKTQTATTPVASAKPKQLSDTGANALGISLASVALVGIGGAMLTMRRRNTVCEKS